MLTSEKSKTPVPHFHLLLRASRTGKLAVGALICVLAVLPQTIGGLLLAYTRTRLGLRAAMLQHALYNALYLASDYGWL